MLNQELLPYYERELIFLRKLAGEFAEQYPERAAALRMDERGSDDPHVERILQGVALIAGRIQHKLDEQFPEITNALLELLYPHLVRPVPPMTILQFAVDPELSKQPEGVLLPRATMAYSAPIEGAQCGFRTAYPVRLWPMEVAEAQFGNASSLVSGAMAAGARHALRLQFRLLGGATLGALRTKDLRLRIGGDGQAAHWMYEQLFTNVRSIAVRSVGADGRPAGDEVLLRGEQLKQVGFERDEALLPVSDTSFGGYRLLQEYFSYPQKFLFFDITGLDAMQCDAKAQRFDIVMLLGDVQPAERALLLESAVNRDMFQLGCTPAINLFEKRGAEPIRLSHTKAAYPIIPDVYAPLGYEIYSVDKVLAEGGSQGSTKEYRPFYSLQHGVQQGQAESFWFALRGQSTRGVGVQEDVFLSFVDREFRLSQPAGESITLRLTCSNANLASRLRTNVWKEVDLEAGALVQARLVDAPTKTLRPPSRGARQWRLISHLSLNHLSLGSGGAEALREMLRLYDPSPGGAGLRQIDGVMQVRSARKLARINSEHGLSFCPGVAIEAEFDEEKFSGSSAYLLANILDRFFGLYCSVNSFTQFKARTRQRESVVWQWPIRSGEQAVA